LSELFKLVYNLYLAINIVKMIKLRRMELENVRCTVEAEPQLKFGQKILEEETTWET
jgi:hypothetical protein